MAATVPEIMDKGGTYLIFNYFVKEDFNVKLG
jgi:hypothetical protein